ncbi:NAD(P)-dependent oxidoreductase [Paraburkholderia sediminicola]|uniref:NAD(P)-dependent oxidoreductase n=1 Tax=Paraburkholderia sediminicola TaxID=458836 RepID=UPI0038B804EB
MKLGFIGLGVMGEPMCANLVRKAGLDVIAFDLQQEPLSRVQEHGALTVGTAAEVGKRADIVFLSLPTIDHVESVCFGTEGLVGPEAIVRVIVDMSTSDVQKTRVLASRLAEHKIQLIDAPVARTRQAAQDGTLLITVGASAESFNLVAPLLAQMGSDVVHCGEIGCGQVVKIMNNMVLLVTVNALAEAAAIGRAAGVDAELLLNTLAKGSADSFALRNPGLKSIAANTFPEKAFPTDYALKDLRLALTLANGGGIAADSAATTARLLERASADGYGALYYPVMVKAIEERRRRVVAD